MRIEDLTLEQLMDLNDAIVKRIKELRARETMQTLQQLRLGQQVHFDTREGRIFGTLIKINRKTVIVVSEDGRQWKVYVELVTGVRDVQ